MDKPLIAFLIRCRPKQFGVTAYSLNDALSILQEKVYRKKKGPSFGTASVDVCFEDLDPVNVAPYIGDMTIRGIWFPRGYHFTLEKVKKVIVIKE
ncbi:MAG TPA: hypothetical protein VI461_15810 [Chitinophagaceae bacterium]|nr:hypothetical protein [Chitinophagaceae bacterium]